MKEFIEELENNQRVNYKNKLENRIDIDYVIERLRNIENKNIYKSFNYNNFKKELEESDLSGLEYLEKNLIDKLKENYDKHTWDFTREEYLVNLFYATLYLNKCNMIFEISNVENNFKYDLYFQTKDLLLEELEKEIKNND